MLDVSFAMSLDLNSILKDWPHENGSIKVRKVAGLDGREKLQLRVDLDLFTFVAEHTDREEFSWSLQQFRPYVLMMNTRAKASILLGQGKFAEAISEIERGREVIVDFLQQSNFPELVSKSSEIAFLNEWLEEVKAKRPLSKLEIMQREMETAIAKELYERAAELRDAIKLLKTQKQA